MALDYKNSEYYAQRQKNTAEIPENFEGLGYYQYVKLSEIVNDFMLSKVGDGMHINKADRYKVEYYAQRAVQEFSYDILNKKSFEYELVMNNSVPLPQDFINEILVSWVGIDGKYRPLLLRRDSGNPKSPLQDDGGNIIFDSNGNIVYANNSLAMSKYNNGEQDAVDIYENYFAGQFGGDEYFNRSYAWYGRQYGGVPEQMNVNGTYIKDYAQGVIYVDSRLSGQTIVIDYVSDGLSEDLSEIQVPKMAEKAVLKDIEASILESMALVPEYVVQRVKREAMASKRNTKIRLSDLKPQMIKQVMANKNQWIKR